MPRLRRSSEFNRKMRKRPSLKIVLPRALGQPHELFERVGRLHAEQHGSRCDERGHAAQAERSGAFLIGNDFTKKLMSLKRALQSFAVQSFRGSQLRKHVHAAYIFAALEECAKDCLVHLIESSLTARPRGCFVREPRAGLHGRQLHPYPQSFCKRIN